MNTNKGLIRSSERGRTLGSIRTEKKSSSSRINGKLGGRRPKLSKKKREEILASSASLAELAAQYHLSERTIYRIRNGR